MKILICAGHTTSGKGTGATGYINESNENRVLSNLVVSYLKKAGHAADYYEINKANDYLQKQVSFANSKSYDLVVQIHFNANVTTNNPVGTETLYSSNRGKPWAEKVTNKLGSFYKQRGIKYRDDLYWLNNTKSPAILVETCFVDSKADTDLYLANKDKTARLIAEAIHGGAISPNSESSNSTNSVSDSNSNNSSSSNNSNSSNTSSKFSNGDYSGKTATVNTDSLNIRYDRGTNFEIIGKLKKGDTVSLGYCLDGWMAIQGYKGNKGFGYVSSEYLDLNNNTVESTPSSSFSNGDYSGKSGIVTTDSLNVRFNRGTNYKIIGKLKKGDIVDFGYCLDGWMGIHGYKGNKGFGYVSTEYISINDKEDVRTSFSNGSFSGRKAKVTVDVLNVRFGRGTNCKIIGKLKKGDIVDLAYCLNGWIGIHGYKGSEGFGYVSTKYLELV